MRMSVYVYACIMYAWIDGCSLNQVITCCISRCREFKPGDKVLLYLGVVSLNQVIRCCCI